MRETMELWIQLLGFVLQTVPIVCFYILTEIEINGRGHWKKYAAHLGLAELFFAGGFVCLCWIMEERGFSRLWGDLYALVMIVLFFLWFWKEEKRNEKKKSLDRPGFSAMYRGTGCAHS